MPAPTLPKPKLATVPQTRYTTLIFDIGDVLVNWTPVKDDMLPPKELRRMLVSPTWAKFECGRISEEECYRCIASKLGVDVHKLASTLDASRKTLQFNSELFNFIDDVKARYGLSVYAMSNISAPDFAYIRSQEAPWGVFDDIYTSCQMQERKPDMPFYQKVLAHGNIDPTRTVFVDDKLDNVISARALGMKGIVFQSTEQVLRSLTNSLCGSVERARHYLQSHAGQLDSKTNTGIQLMENFAQFLIFDVTGGRSLIKYADSDGLFNFFQEKSQLTTEAYPCDLDTTALAWTTVKNGTDAQLHHVMDQMLRYLTPDGIVQDYFDNERPRLDPVVCVNVLSFFDAHGRIDELTPTLEWVGAILENRGYEDGTRYYTSGEPFLYFFARLLSRTGDASLRNRFEDTLAERLTERIGSPGDSLALAMRIIACSLLGLKNKVDMNRLLERQEMDGSWSDGWFYHYGMTGVQIGNSGLTTAFAVKAIELVASPEK
ncbi:HAD-like protein [Schizopora paradoxa]|uniref:HAD-like protein n=1 Tax=Schizopora paradoxa TaxID=27342 RepID=A0A0H2RN08_9AGAM|nr:HAD-like protein [Schizopora paradoxa]